MIGDRVDETRRNFSGSWSEWSSALQFFFRGCKKGKTSKFPCFAVIRLFFSLNVLLLELNCLDKLKLEYTLCQELSSTALRSL